MGEDERDAVWKLLPERAAKLAVAVRLMPWTADEIGAWVATSIGERKGTWITGAPGAIAEFPCTADRDIRLISNGVAVTADAHDAAFRLTLHDKLRAFQFSNGGPVVLGWPKARMTPYGKVTLTNLGRDDNAIVESSRTDAWLDLGVGRAANRFCLRTRDVALIETLRGLVGQHWSKVMHEAGMQILTAGPHRVVESHLARIEVLSPIPMPGSIAPPGACTRFLPEFLKSGDELPPSLALPDYVAPVAIFYPHGAHAA